MKRTSLWNRVHKISHNMPNSVVNTLQLVDMKRHFKHIFLVTFAPEIILSLLIDLIKIF